MKNLMVMYLIGLEKKDAKKEVINIHEAVGLEDLNGKTAPFPDWWPTATIDEKYDFLEREKVILIYVVFKLLD